MKFQSLKIRRTESYETPSGQLVGVAELFDEEQGQLSVKLDHGTLITVLAVLKDCVTERSKRLAKDAPKGLTESISELQIAQDTFLSLPSKD